MIASPSRAKMEELVSTRLIPSSAFACRATGGTRVRKVRALQSNRQRNISWLWAVWEVLSCTACFWEMKLDYSAVMLYYVCTIFHVKRVVVCFAGGNNPNQCAVSVSAICPNSISQSFRGTDADWISKIWKHFSKQCFALTPGLIQNFITPVQICRLLTKKQQILSYMIASISR